MFNVMGDFNGEARVVEIDCSVTVHPVINQTGTSEI